jgi:hypothetical protein
VALLAGAPQHHPYLLLRQRLLGLGGRRDADERGDLVGGPVEHDQPRQEDVVEELHRRRDEQREPLGPGDGDGLRRQLAEDDVEERHDAEPDADGDEVDRRRREQRRQQGLDERRDGGFADPPQPQGGDGDAELGRREVVVEVVQGVLQGSRPGPALIDHLVDRRRPDADERELGGDEEAVERDEKQRREQPARRQQEVHHCSFPRRRPAVVRARRGLLLVVTCCRVGMGAHRLGR